MLIPVWEGLKIPSPQCRYKCASGLWNKLASGFRHLDTGGTQVWAVWSTRLAFCTV